MWTSNVAVRGTLEGAAGSIPPQQFPRVGKNAQQTDILSRSKNALYSTSRLMQLFIVTIQKLQLIQEVQWSSAVQ